VTSAPRWIVDGMNVIGSRPDGWWRDRPGAVRRLTEALARRHAATGDDITVVYDGRAVPDLPDGVQVMFAATRGRDAADDEIVRVVGADVDPSSLRVVTSDAGLAARVRALGAQVVPSSDFRAQLDA
jgi:predicted RNA-binding protein with PIN domain